MKTTAVPDNDLVRQILAGQREAFASLVERYLQSALAIARARLLNPIDADDAVQEAFLRAYAQLRTLREPAKFGPWLLTIVRHEAARYVTRNRSTVGGDPDTAPESTAQPDLSQREVHALLRARIEQLPETAREVLLLHYFAGRTTREIAELLNLRQTAVLKRLQRARETLAENLLHEIERERPVPASLSRQAARIAALTGGLTIASNAAAGSMFAAVFGLLSTKTFAVTAGLAGLAVVAGLAVQTARPPHDAASAIQQAASPEPTAVAAPEATQAPLSAGPSGSSAQPFPVQPVEPSQPSETADAQNTSRQREREAPVHVAEVLRALDESSAKHFYIDQRAVGVPHRSEPDPRPARSYAVDGQVESVRIPINTPILDAINEIATPLGLKAVLAPGYVFVSTPAQIRADGFAYSHAEYNNYPDWNERLSMRLAMDHVHISELMEFINEVTNRNIVLDSRVIASPHPKYKELPALPRGKSTDGRVPYINLKDVRLEDALRAMARVMELRVVVCRDYFWMSRPNLIKQDGLSLLSRGRTEAMQKLEGSPITIQFEDVHANEIFRFVYEIFDTVVVLDQRVVAWNDEPYTGVPLPGLSNPPATISAGLLHQVAYEHLSEESALEVIARSLNLVYEVQGDRVIFTAPDLLSSIPSRPGDLVPAQEFAAQIQSPMRYFLQGRN